jgi:hypothetical protein
MEQHTFKNVIPSTLYLETSRANVIKHFTAISYDFSKKARVFISGKPFQPKCFIREGFGLTRKH